VGSGRKIPNWVFEVRSGVHRNIKSGFGIIR